MVLERAAARRARPLNADGDEVAAFHLATRPDHNTIRPPKLLCKVTRETAGRP